MISSPGPTLSKCSHLERRGARMGEQRPRCSVRCSSSGCTARELSVAGELAARMRALDVAQLAPRHVRFVEWDHASSGWYSSDDREGERRYRIGGTRRR